MLATKTAVISGEPPIDPERGMRKGVDMDLGSKLRRRVGSSQPKNGRKDP
jgi:hypothetical protein